ncbi:ultra-long-chain fatty acid omega-hydroxylase-like [Haliotis rubra]|uniref:ultra-long-chain fatty acid omega-hydroxylase-like n=1 Tax=Haliotis rubra TaxID=36100 RepID=UPI001EE5B2B2|nr:ultra-long-chain fatty acid omega-hydroxylase-like [Haliotis rubra]
MAIFTSIRVQTKKELPTTWTSSKGSPLFVRVWTGSLLPFIVVHHPDTVKRILRSSEPKPHSRYISMPMEMGMPWLGMGLLFSNGIRWERTRRLLTPAFHFLVLRQYMKVYNEAADVLLATYSFQDRLNRLSRMGEPFECFSTVGLYSLDVLLRCAFSHRTNCQTEERHPYVQAVKEMIRLWGDRAFNPLLYLDIVYYRTSNGKQFLRHCRYVHRVAEDIVQKRAAVVGVQTKRKHDFMDILLMARDQHGNGLTFREIRNEVDTFLFAGHDTTTSGISWLLYHLAKYPDHQSRVQQEIDTVLTGQSLDYIEWEHLPQLVHLTLCVKESLRLCPPVPLIQRQLTKAMDIQGTQFPVGTIMTVNIHSLGLNPHVWPDPQEYQPERFLPENTRTMDPFAFVPFSAGPRNCIGQNFALNVMKVIVSRILHRYTLTLDPSHTVRRWTHITMTTETGIKIFATPRSTTHVT